jgi:hypothetical protein
MHWRQSKLIKVTVTGMESGMPAEAPTPAGAGSQGRLDFPEGATLAVSLPVTDFSSGQSMVLLLRDVTEGSGELQSRHVSGEQVTWEYLVSRTSSC